MSSILVNLIRFMRRMKQLARNEYSAFVLRFFPDRWRWFEKNISQFERRGVLQAYEKPFVSFETTDICNLNCIMCETWSATRTKGIMKMDDFVGHLDRIQALGQNSVAFHTIGDPLMDKEVGEKLRLCYERGIEVDLRTNGLLLDKYLSVIVKYPPGRLRISIDGGTKETYERIRVRGKFDKLLANLNLLKGAFVKHRILCELGVDMVVFGENLHEIPIFYQVFHPYFKLTHMHFHIINSLSGDHGDFFDKEKLSSFSQPVPPCKMPFTSLFILHDQRVSVCCRDYHEELIVGDLKNETIEQIWSGKSIHALREAHEQAKSTPSNLPRACRECYSPTEHTAQVIDVFIHQVLQKSISKYGIKDLPIDQMATEIRTYLERLSEQKLLEKNQHTVGNH